MAKGNRIIVKLECSKCKNKNYSTTINRVNQREKKLEVQKHCPNCEEHTLHIMTKAK